MKMPYYIRVTCLILLGMSGFSNVQAQSQPPFRTGVNFPFLLPEIPLDTYLNRLSETGAPVIRQMIYADVFWKNVESTENDWNFTLSDSAYFNPYGIQPVGTLFSMMGAMDSTGIQVPWKACSNPFLCFWQPDKDSLETRDYVQTVVNRYKGVTSYWEIANEFEHSSPPKGLKIPGMLPFRQADFLTHVYRWIKEADSSSNVLLPGLLGTHGYPVTQSYQWLRDFLSVGGCEAFDIMNYHDYNSWWTLPAHFDSVYHALSTYDCHEKPIWITECSVSSINVSPITPDYSSPNEQAADVWRRPGLLWAKGAEVVFWHSFWSSGNLMDWGEFGLLNNQGFKKKSFHSYALLVEKLGSFDNATHLALGTVTESNEQGGDGVWVISFIKEGKPMWLLWSPDQLPFTLQGIPGNQISVTHVVPHTLLQNGEEALFTVDTLNIVDNSHTFTSLSSLPILVEVVDPINAIADIEESFTLRLFPNPTADILDVQWSSPSTTPCSLFVANQNGVMVYAKKDILEGQHRMEVMSWPAGWYYVYLENEAGRKVATGKWFIP